MSKKKTTEEFIEDAKKVHGEKYDYSLVNYVNSKVKVKIICKEHGEFVQIPNSHLNGKGCPICGKETSSKKRRLDFIKAAKLVHGDKYDYSLVNYVNGKTKVKIICPIHGEFEQIAENHLDGHGCSKCRSDKLRSNGKTTEQFIEEAKKIHGERYDYSLVNYVNNKTKVKIICREHGVFEQFPTDHLKGYNCPKCKKSRKKTTEQFIEESKLIHGEKYDYSLVDYINGKTKVKIICKKCGKVFEQKPENHLDGCGCVYCNGTPKKTTEQFIEETKLIHGDRYDYSLVDYKGNKIKVKIICRKCGKVFEQTPLRHLIGDNCPNCAINKKLTQEEFIEESKKVHGEKYDYSLTNYVNNNTKVKIICKKHGIFKQLPTNHLDGHGCKECRKEFLRKKFALTTEEFIERSRKIHGDKYDYSLTNYVNNNTKVKIICRKHGIFEQFPDRHYNGANCPCCQYFKGEQRIANYLTNKGIEFVPQKSFDDLRDIKLLSYDFYIEEYNLLIEFNGEQHYRAVEYFHKDLHDFHKQLHHDWLKRKYAQKNNIELLTIPYWDYDKIEEILGEAIDNRRENKII